MRELIGKAYRHRRAIGISTVAGMAVAGTAATIAGKKLWERAWPKADLRNKVVLITGGSRGLGLALAQEFAAEGARIAICARHPEELEVARQKLERQGATVLALTCDVSSDDDVKLMVRKVLEHYNRIDVLVNAAGIISVGPMESQTLVDYQESMDVMFWGIVSTTLAVLPHMRSRGSGHIVNITSIGGKVSIPHLLPYNCAKFAAVGFSEGLHAEVAKDGIQVTTVVPGLMRTGSYVNAYFKGNSEAELGWFSVASSMPVMAKNARRAARQIVSAVRNGRAELTITPQAKLLAITNGIAPGLLSRILAASNRVLPAARQAGEQRYAGKELSSAVSRSPLTYFGRRAGHELNEYAKESTPLRNPA